MFGHAGSCWVMGVMRGLSPPLIVHTVNNCSVLIIFMKHMRVGAWRTQWGRRAQQRDGTWHLEVHLEKYVRTQVQGHLAPGSAPGTWKCTWPFKFEFKFN